MRKVYYDRRSECLQPMLSIIEKLNHRALVLWAFEYAEYLLNIFSEKYPEETRPHLAIALCRQWASGAIKMPLAKIAILDTHRAAKDIEKDAVYCAICHAIGQALSTVHVETHAIGGPMYALTALAKSSEPDEAENAVTKECERLCERLLFWQEYEKTNTMTWADFLRRDKPNKELLLRLKNEYNNVDERT